MANSTSPFGFMPYGRVDGGSPTYELEKVNINSSDTNLYFTGDMVCRSSAGVGNNVITINVGSTDAHTPAGVFWGCKFFSAAAGRVVWSRNFPGSVGANATVGVSEGWIISDPNTLFRAASASGTFANADIGNNVTIVTSQSSLGNTVTGQSAMIVSTTLVGASSHPWKIFDLLANRSPVGTPGADASANNQVILLPNNWERSAGTVGITTT